MKIIVTENYSHLSEVAAGIIAKTIIDIKKNHAIVAWLEKG